MSDRIGEWTVVQKLGDGSMGVVYEVRNAGGQRGALKMLRPEHCANAKLAERFRRESRILQRIQDRNVVRLLEAGEHEGQTYMVLEFIDGPSLEDHLQEHGPLKGDAARQLAVDLLRGLDAVHERGLVHRDVKPSNLMLGSDGAWKLTDFGLARRDSAEESIVVTRQGAVLGTPHYMAPEQCEGANAEPRSDLYGAGAAMFQAFTGETLYDKPTFMDVIKAQISEPPRPLQAVAPDAAKDVAKLVDRCLKKKAVDRPSSAKEALAILGAAPREKPPAVVAEVARLQTAPTMIDEAPGRGSSAELPAKEPSARETTRSLKRPTAGSPAKKTTTRRQTSERFGQTAERLREQALRRSSTRVDVSGIRVAGGRASPVAAAVPPLLGVAAVIGVTILFKKNPSLLGTVGLTQETFATAWPFWATVAISCLFGLAFVRFLWVYATVNAPEHATLRTPLERLRGKLAYARASQSDPHRAAELMRALGAPTSAGQLLMDAGRYAEAAVEFLSASQHTKAALAFERAGQLERARDAYLAANEIDHAARVMTEAGRHEDAGELYLAAGRTQKAIDALRKAEKRHRLIDLLEQIGSFVEAGAEAEAILAGMGTGGRFSSGDKKTLARRGADLYAQGGDLAHAAALLEQAEDHEEALDLVEQLGDHERAAALALSLGHRLRAAVHLEQLGRDVEAARARAEHYFAAHDAANAAPEFDRAGEFGRAARCYEEAKLFADAARCAEKAVDDELAARCWAAAGEPARAAGIFERIGEHAQAAGAWRASGDKSASARAFERAGEPVKAAEAWLSAGSRADALRVLQAVPAGSRHKHAALGLLGDLLAESGRDTEAMVAYATALEDAELDETVVRRMLSFATVLARLGNEKRAVATLRRLQGSPHAPADLDARIEVMTTGVAVKTPRRKPDRRALRGGRDLVGTEIDRYKLLSFLGEGGTAWIYKAEHAFLGRVAALKVLKARPEENEELVSRFLSEGRAVAQIRHPNLIEVYDFGQTEDGRLYMALEFVSGGSLRELIARGEKVAPNRLARLGADVLAGLAAAHKKGIVHRDLKPENILLDDAGRPKIVDFGIAKTLSASESVTSDFLGTPRYASPEQALGKAIGPAADQYAFGLIFYELAARKLPFESATAVGWLTLHASEKPRALQELAPDLPGRLTAAIMRCLEKDPAARWPDLEMLQRVFASAAF